AEYVARVNQAEAQVAAAKAAIEVSQRKRTLQRPVINAASAAFEASRAGMELSVIEAARHDRLSVNGLGSAQDHKRATFDAARQRAELQRHDADKSRAVAELALLASEERQLEAILAAREAALEEAKIQLGYTRIEAPADGVVGERGVRVGQLVRPGTQII